MELMEPLMPGLLITPGGRRLSHLRELAARQDNHRLMRMVHGISPCSMRLERKTPVQSAQALHLILFYLNAGPLRSAQPCYLRERLKGKLRIRSGGEGIGVCGTPFLF